MSCLVTQGRIEPCKDSVGGLKNVYVINYGDLGAITYDTSSDTITTFGDSPTAYQFELKGASSFDQTITASRDAGTTFYDQVLTLTLKKLDKNTNDELALLAVGRPHILVEDNNGNVFTMGLTHGADVNGGTVVTGTSMGDLSGYTLTFQAQETKPANFLFKTSDTESVVTTLTNAGVSISASQIDPGA